MVMRSAWKTGRRRFDSGPGLTHLGPLTGAFSFVARKLARFYDGSLARQPNDALQTAALWRAVLS